MVCDVTGIVVWVPDTFIVVADVTGIVVWVVEGIVVVMTEVAVTVVWVGDTVWVVFAAPAGNTTVAAQARNTKNIIMTVQGELPAGD